MHRPDPPRGAPRTARPRRRPRRRREPQHPAHPRPPGRAPGRRWRGRPVQPRPGGADDAQASEQLECGWEGSAAGEPFSIAFNPQYLLDGLGAVDSDSTTLSFTGPTRPAVLTGKRDADAAPGAVADYRYLLMPVRLSG